MNYLIRIKDIINPQKRGSELSLSGPGSDFLSMKTKGRAS
jgi:hypothetical protein